MKLKKWLIGIGIIASLICPRKANTDYYVEVTGNDTNSGTSIEQPLRTLEEAFNRSGENKDTIHLGEGTFDLFPGAVKPYYLSGDSLLGSGKLNTLIESSIEGQSGFVFYADRLLIRDLTFNEAKLMIRGNYNTLDSVVMRFTRKPDEWPTSYGINFSPVSVEDLIDGLVDNCEVIGDYQNGITIGLQGVLAWEKGKLRVRNTKVIGAFNCLYLNSNCDLGTFTDLGNNTLQSRDFFMTETGTYLNGTNLYNFDGGHISAEGNMWLDPIPATPELKAVAFSTPKVLTTPSRVYNTIIDEGNPAHNPEGQNYTRVNLINTGEPIVVPSTKPFGAMSLAFVLLGLSLYEIKQIKNEK